MVEDVNFLELSLLIMAIMGGWTALEWCVKVLLRTSRESRMRKDSSMRRLDGPFLFLMLSASATGCSGITRKTIVLYDMPRTIEIHRGWDVSDEAAGLRNTWGAARRVPSQDKCIIYLDWDRGVGTDLHEFIHCAGHNEDETRALMDPE